MNEKTFLWVAVIALAVLLANEKGCTTQPSMVVVVYESEEGMLPPEVWGKINSYDGEIRVIDDDTVNENNQPPEYLKEPIERAKKHGLPAVVLGTEVIGTDEWLTRN